LEHIVATLRNKAIVGTILCNNPSQGNCWNTVAILGTKVIVGEVTMGNEVTVGS
jgi:hypothetical protein